MLPPLGLAQAAKASSFNDKDQPPRPLVSFPAWAEHVQKVGLLVAPDQRPQEAAAVASAQCGVSLLFLLELSRQLNTLLPPDATTATVVSKAIIPYTGGSAKSKKCRLWDCIPPVYISRPSTYVVHAWGAPFQQMVAQLISSQGANTESEHIARVFVWLDIVALPQQLELTACSDLPSIKEMAAAFVGEMAVVVDKKHLVLSRTWCMYEIWMFIYHNQVTNLRVCVPEDESVDGIVSLESKCKQLDITNTRSTVSDDRVHILSEIRKSVGMKIMQRTLNDALMLVIRKSLRWSDRFEDFALYCTVLLRNGEHAALQDALHGLADLDDESVVSIDDVQKIFDAIADPSTEALRFEQFESLIKDLGLPYDNIETKAIFSQLTKHNKPEQYGCINKHAFFQWYRSLEKAWVRVDHVKSPADMSTEALVENLRRMQMYLLHKELPQLAAEFKYQLQQHQQGLILPLGTPLATAELRGNWLVVSNDVAWRLHTHDYRGATAVLHSLLMWNGDIIDTNPSTLIKQDTKNMPLKPLCKVLLQYMEIFVLLLKQHPRTTEHTAHQRFYTTCTEQLLAPEALESLVKAHRKGQVSHTQVVISRAVKELERNAVVQNMIKLKYGNNRPMDGRHLVVEAELSVAELLCITKGGVKPAGALPYVNYLSHDRDVEDKVSSVIASGKMMQQMRLRSKYGSDEKSVLLRLGSEAEAFFKEQQEMDQAQEVQRREKEEEQRREKEEAGDTHTTQRQQPLVDAAGNEGESEDESEDEGGGLLDLQAALQVSHQHHRQGSPRSSPQADAELGARRNPGAASGLRHSPFSLQGTMLTASPGHGPASGAMASGAARAGARPSDTGQGSDRQDASPSSWSGGNRDAAAPRRMSNTSVSAGMTLPNIGSFDRAVGHLNPNPLLRIRESKGSAGGFSSPPRAQLSPFTSYSSASPPPARASPADSTTSSPLSKISQATAEAAAQSHSKMMPLVARQRSISMSGLPLPGSNNSGTLPKISANQQLAQKSPLKPLRPRLSLAGSPARAPT